MVGKLRLADTFCVAPLDKQQYLKLIESCDFILNVFSFISVFTRTLKVSYQGVYTM